MGNHIEIKKIVFVLTPGIDLSPCESPDIPLTILDTTALHQSRQDDDDDEGDVLNNSLTPMDWLPRYLSLLLNEHELRVKIIIVGIQIFI